MMSYKTRKFCRFTYFKAVIVYYISILAWTSWLKMDVLGTKWRKGWCNIDPNELVVTFGVSYVCANFRENR